MAAVEIHFQHEQIGSKRKALLLSIAWGSGWSQPSALARQVPLHCSGVSEPCASLNAWPAYPSVCQSISYLSGFHRFCTLRLCPLTRPSAHPSTGQVFERNAYNEVAVFRKAGQGRRPWVKRIWGRVRRKGR